MKHHYYAFAFTCTLLFATSVSHAADGTVAPASVDVVPTDTVTTVEATHNRIAQLTTLVRLYSRVMSLHRDLPTATAADEGLLTVVINDDMIFSCPQQPTDRCVRHIGRLGVSVIDLANIQDFRYDNRFSYAVTLLKTRTSDNRNDVPHQYQLIEITDVTYRP